MATVDELARAEQALERLEKDRETILGDLKGRLQKDNLEPTLHPAEREKLVNQIDSTEKIYADTMGKARERVGSLRAAVARDQEERRAQAKRQSDRAEQAEKHEAQARWIRGGGDPATFEAAWPGMWERMLEKRATQPREPLIHL